MVDIQEVGEEPAAPQEDLSQRAAAVARDLVELRGRFSGLRGRIWRAWLPYADESGLRLAPAGLVNLAVALFFAFSAVLVATGMPTWLVLCVFVPTSVYAAAWRLYPIVEPSDGPEKVLETMRRHPHMRQAQMDGTEALLALTRGGGPSKRQKMLATLVDGGAVECLLEALFAFADDGDLVARAVAALGHLALAEGLAVALIEDGALRFAGGYLDTWRARESVCNHTLVLLVSLLSASDPAAGAALVARQGEVRELLPLVCTAMDAHVTVSRVQQWGCVALFYLGELLGPERLVAASALQQVAKAMANHPQAETVNRLGVGVLAKALTFGGNPGYRKSLEVIAAHRKAIFDVVEAARKQFPNIPEVQTGAQRILEDCRL